MRFAITTVPLCWLTLQALTATALFPFRDIRNPEKKDRATSDAEGTKRLPKYLIKLFHRRVKTLTDNVNTIRGVFPKKTIRSKRALRLVFDQNYLQNKKLWMKDELRLYMNKAKAPLSSSKQPYLIRIYDLYSKKLINEYKLPTEYYGWQTIEITGWRDIGESRIRNKQVGLKLVVQLGKKRLRIEHTPFWKSKAKREPYLVVFLTDDEKIGENTSNPRKSIYRDNPNEVLPFERFKLFRLPSRHSKKSGGVGAGI